MSPILHQRPTLFNISFCFQFKCARYWPAEEGFDDTLDTFGEKINVKIEYEHQHPSYMESKIIMTRGKKVDLTILMLFNKKYIPGIFCLETD